MASIPSPIDQISINYVTRCLDYMLQGQPHIFEKIYTALTRLRGIHVLFRCPRNIHLIRCQVHPINHFTPETLYSYTFKDYLAAILKLNYRRPLLITMQPQNSPRATRVGTFEDQSVCPRAYCIRHFIMWFLARQCLFEQ